MHWPLWLAYGNHGRAAVADDGSVPFPDKRRPTAIVPEIPVYPIHPAAIPLTGTGGHRFVGYIDRLDRDDRTGTVTVVDYKTRSIATSVRRFMTRRAPWSPCRYRRCASSG